MSADNKILIIHTAFIGDIILLTPLIETLLASGKTRVLDVLINPATKNVMENNPRINKIWLYDKRGKDAGLKGFLALAKQVRNQGYDIVLSPHRSLRSALLARSSGARLRIGFNTSAGHFLFNRKVTYLSEIHEIERNLEFARALGVTELEYSPVVYASKEDERTVERFLIRHFGGTKAPLVALAPGSIWATKRWPQKYYAELADKLSGAGLHPILIGGPQDIELCNSIVHLSTSRPAVAAGTMTLAATAVLLKACTLLVSNDSAAMHLSTAVKTPVIAIFGPTVKEFGFYPTGPHDVVIERELSCRPCGLHGGKSCPIKTFECMLGIQPQRVFGKLQQILEHVEQE